MSPLVVVTGPPGAGKSTVAELLVGSFDPSALVAGDDMFAAVRSGYALPWLAGSHRQNEVVIEAAAAAAGRFADGGYTVVYEGMVGPWFIDRFAACAGSDEVHYIVLTPSLETCLARVATRVGHGFSDADATRYMWHEFATADVAARHVVTVGDDDTPAHLADLVAQRLSDGLLRLVPEPS